VHRNACLLLHPSQLAARQHGGRGIYPEQHPAWGLGRRHHPDLQADHWPGGETPSEGGPTMVACLIDPSQAVQKIVALHNLQDKSTHNFGMTTTSSTYIVCRTLTRVWIWMSCLLPISRSLVEEVTKILFGGMGKQPQLQPATARYYCLHPC